MWVNSFFRHKRRGTWWHRVHAGAGLSSDGFIGRKDQRTRLFKKIRTIAADGLSDHRPKLAVITKLLRRTQRRGNVGEKIEERRQICWEKLRDKTTAEKYGKRCTKRLLEERADTNWDTLAKIMVEEDEGTCGRKRRQGDSTWLRGKDTQINKYKERITTTTRRIRGDWRSDPDDDRRASRV